MTDKQSEVINQRPLILTVMVVILLVLTVWSFFSRSPSLTYYELELDRLGHDTGDWNLLVRFGILLVGGISAIGMWRRKKWVVVSFLVLWPVLIALGRAVGMDVVCFSVCLVFWILSIVLFLTPRMNAHFQQRSNGS